MVGGGLLRFGQIGNVAVLTKSLDQAFDLSSVTSYLRGNFFLNVALHPEVEDGNIQVGVGDKSFVLLVP